METVFDKFGGIRPMADHLRESPSTVQGWKTAGRIPAGKQPAVLAKARELGLQITAADVIFPMGHNHVDTHQSSASSPGSGDEISQQLTA